MKHTSNSAGLPFAIGFAALAALVVSLLAITGDSLWIDELMTVHLAKGENFAEFQQRLGMLSTSDNLMPFYMTFVHWWENVFGYGEHALRLANLPWFVFGVVSIWHLLRENPRLRLLSLGLLFATPFTWYYLNEARPYAMQISTGCAVMACTARLLWTRNSLHSSDMIITTIGLIVMSGASLLSVPWTGLFLLLMAWAIYQGRVAAPKLVSIGCCVAVALVLAGLGFYYLKVLATGARAATAFGGIFQGLAFSVYEVLGFAGLGPGRDDLRQNGPSAFKPIHFALILPLLLAYAGVALAALTSIKNSRSGHDWKKPLLATIGLLVPGIIFFVLLGLLKDFRVLGRHLAPITPGIAIAIAATLLAVRPIKLRRGLTIAILALLLVSAAMIRLSDRHLRDDYRQAIELINSEHEARRDVLWVGNLAGLANYPTDGIPRQAVPGTGIHIFRFGHGHSWESPRMVLISKPDIHDPKGYATALLKDGNYRLDRTFPGFEVWVK